MGSVCRESRPARIGDAGGRRRGRAGGLGGWGERMCRPLGEARGVHRGRRVGPYPELVPLRPGGQQRCLGRVRPAGPASWTAAAPQCSPAVSGPGAGGPREVGDGDAHVAWWSRRRLPVAALLSGCWERKGAAVSASREAHPGP